VPILALLRARTMELARRVALASWAELLPVNADRADGSQVGVAAVDGGDAVAWPCFLVGCARALGLGPADLAALRQWAQTWRAELGR